MGNARHFVERGYRLLYDARDPAAFVEYFLLPEGEILTPGGRIEHGQAQGWLQGWLDGFPDLKARIVDIVEAGPTVAIEVRYTGTNSAPMAGPNGVQPATGRPIDLWSAEFIRIEGSRFASWHMYFDMLTYQRQLGLVPEPAGAC